MAFSDVTRNETPKWNRSKTLTSSVHHTAILILVHL